MSRDLNTFRIGDVINVPGIPEYQHLTITRISDTGVTVNGPRCGYNVIISGRTPAVLNDSDEIIEDNSTSDRSPRGMYAERLNAPKMPGPQFTIRQFAELNDVPPNYALTWVKEHCTKVGEAEKAEGQRGKAAALYQLNIT